MTEPEAYRGRRSLSSRLGLGLLSLGLTSALLVACSPSTPAPSGTSSAAVTGSASTSASPTGTASGSAAPTSSGSGSKAGAQPSAGASASVGGLVGGFPATLIPLMPGAQVLQSAVDSSSDPATVSLVATSSAATADIVGFYTQALQAQGFTALAGDAVGSVASKDFVRNNGKDTINIAISSTNGVNTFTVGAVVAPSSLK
ncbi:hypothetical protein [Psychromicrobium xiongbiense]|uniref:hypothetical protein n=1 Tax=Psychromicrobium xiongbiense TaxID=3051184 RepID=UPI0025558B9F|nr:hypothetical protein [Psychromicrobium sp. YIM S02556]